MLQSAQLKSKNNKENNKLKIAIVKSLYYQELTSRMTEACKEVLINSGVLKTNIDLFSVPGSWELPIVCAKLACLKKYDGIVVFGVLIKGETLHFELIANECTRALMNISLEYNIPVTFELLATLSLTQAKKRSSGQNNKGIEAGHSVLEIIQTIKNIS